MGTNEQQVAYHPVPPVDKMVASGNGKGQLHTVIT